MSLAVAGLFKLARKRHSQGPSTKHQINPTCPDVGRTRRALGMRGVTAVILMLTAAALIIDVTQRQRY